MVPLHILSFEFIWRNIFFRLYWYFKYFIFNGRRFRIIRLFKRLSEATRLYYHQCSVLSIVIVTVTDEITKILWNMKDSSFYISWKKMKTNLYLKACEEWWVFFLFFSQSIDKNVIILQETIMVNLSLIITMIMNSATSDQLFKYIIFLFLLLLFINFLQCCNFINNSSMHFCILHVYIFLLTFSSIVL